MAQHVLVQLLDDLTGETADRTVEFGLDGKQYEIDLSLKNHAKLMDALTPFVAAARRLANKPGKQPKAERRLSSVPSKPARTDREQMQAIREWATGAGIKVSSRGRLPSHVMVAFNEAHQSSGKAKAAPVAEALPVLSVQQRKAALTPPVPAAVFEAPKPAPASEATDAHVIAWYQFKGKAMPKGYKEGKATATMRKQYLDAMAKDTTSVLQDA